MEKKQKHKQVLVQPSVLNERLASNLVPLRAERSESVPALYLFLLNHSHNPKKNHTVSQISQLPKHYISANGGNLV